MSDIVIRRAAPGDLPRLGVLAGALVRMHHAEDPQRFFLVDDVEGGYAWWLGQAIEDPSVVVLVAERAGTLLGYAYGSLEERDWMRLLDAHGAFHDLYVVPEVRRGGLGRRLVEAMLAALKALGAPRIVISTMANNEAAQSLARALGFRATMVEMTRDS